MADDDFEEEEDDEPDLEEEVDLEDDDLVLEVDVVAEVEDDVDLLVDEDPVKAVTVPKVGTVAPIVDDGAEEEDDEVVDLEEELHPDDVEEPLDVLLQERTKADRLNEDANDLEDDELEPDDRGEGTARVVPRRDDEFLCRSCFLVKPLSQLAPGEKDLCRDCE
jgi:hypothetical protein